MKISHYISVDHHNKGVNLDLLYIRQGSLMWLDTKIHNAMLRFNTSLRLLQKFPHLTTVVLAWIAVVHPVLSALILLAPKVTSYEDNADEVRIHVQAIGCIDRLLH